MIIHYQGLTTYYDDNGLLNIRKESVIGYTQGTGKKCILDIGIFKVDNGFKRVRTDYIEDSFHNQVTIITIDREVYGK